ncbi:MAG: sodium/solute symporter [Opitutaceae bacterium]
MSTLDVILFVVAVVGVITLGIWQSRKEELKSEHGASDYFLAGRGLTWWLVGFSLIAANISTEQFVGMSGKAADWLGMAIASYEWMAAITLVVVAFLFLPKLLRCGIYTIPEFLEYRYGPFSRFIMAVATLVILVGVPTASVIFSGAKVVSVFFQDTSLLGLDLGNITVGCWLIGTCAAVYVFIGGLKACAWTDLVWGSSLIAGGALVMFLAFQELGSKPAEELFLTKVENSSATVQDLEAAGAWSRFKLLNDGVDKEAIAVSGPNGSGGKIHMVRPKDDPEIPWTALLVGLWIPNFFYWGLNQYIMQRTLGSKSLAEGQKGIIFAAALKLLIPFVVVIPGILAFNLFNGDLKSQADIKNERILAEFASAPQKVFPFSENFAELNPELAGRIVAHNAGVTGSAVPVDLSPDPDLLFAANQTAMQPAATAKIPSATRLIGYDYDAAFPTLLKNLLKPGITWFVLAAIFGAVVSSLASMLNSASTIATMDIFTKVKKNATQYQLVTSGRVFVVVFVLIACLIAPSLGSPHFGGIFTFIQEFQGFISPGILSVFIFGFLVHKAPRYVGWVGIALNIVLYGGLKIFAPQIAFLNRMAICFGIVLLVLTLIRLINPMKQPVVMPVTDIIALESSKSAKLWGGVVVVATLALYWLFW